MPDLDAYLRALADRRRRYLLYHLRDRDVTTVDAIASALVESDPDLEGDLDQRRDEVAVELRHQHLPKLDVLSVVDYDPRSEVVRVLEVPPPLEALLEVTDGLDPDA